MLSHPRTRRAIGLPAGMLIAIVVTLADREIVSYTTIIAGLVVGSAIGWILAVRVQMTAMPQMVGMLNGFGGLASGLVALAEYIRVYIDPNRDPRLDVLIAIGLSALIGMVTFTGSMTAFGKLQGWKIRGKPLSNPLLLPHHHPINIAQVLIAVVLIAVLVSNYEAAWAIVLLYLLAAVLGVMLVTPIGGADMPVVISLMNSYSGLAAMTTGFVLDNYALIISGSLVGASGIILTKIMCSAMNRSLLNVVAGGSAGDNRCGRDIRRRAYSAKMDAEEAAMVLESAQKVFIIPGYGMAVAQRSTPWPSWATSSERRAWTCATGCIRWPGACRGT